MSKSHNNYIGTTEVIWEHPGQNETYGHPIKNLCSEGQFAGGQGEITEGF